MTLLDPTPAVVSSSVVRGPATAELPGSGVSVAGPAALVATARVHDAIDGLDVTGADPRELGALVGGIDRAIARLQAKRLHVLAAADHAHVADQAGMSGTSAWVAATTRTGGDTAAADVRLATALEGSLPLTGAALDAGELSPAHAAVIAATTTNLPEGLDQASRDKVEAHLVGQAKILDPAKLRRVARRALHAAERDAAEVNRHEDQVLRTEEERAYDKTRISFHDNLDGTTSGHFTIPTLAAAILRKTIQQIASPRRHQEGARARGGQPDTTLDWSQRYGQAFVDILEHLPTTHLNGKVAATIVITIPKTDLIDGLGTAHLDTGTDITAGQARRLACNAGLLPAVLGGQSQVLDLGRTNRFFTEAHHVALATTYSECAAEHCDRPYAWSELHHEDPWSHGGPTNLDKAIPLCGHHHRRIHDPNYHHTITTTPAGIKTVTYRRRP